MSLPLTLLHTALVDHLEADAGVSAVTNAVYSRVPPKATAPYIAITQTECEDISDIAKAQFRVRITLQAFTRNRKGGEVQPILDAAHSALENTLLNLSGYSHISTRFENASLRRSGNGQSGEGSMVFELLVHRNVTA